MGGWKIKNTILAVLSLLLAGPLFSQDGTDGLIQRGSVPEELLRPRREETPRYPVDTVIGPLGQGKAPRDAYEVARRTAEALLAGSKNAPVLSTVNSVFLENCMSKLNGVTPRLFRLGGGREGPDGSVSFLVRFAGREQGITGELFIRLQEHRPVASLTVNQEAITAENEVAGDLPETAEASAAAVAEDQPEAQETPVAIPVQKIWIFEDLILEEARSRETENTESRYRFDFSPYERFF